MNLPRLSVKHYVFAFMINAIFILLGLASYQRIGLDRIPKIEYPVVSVSTRMAGANPEIIDASIANTIESAVNSIPGIDYIQSESAPGQSLVNVRFILEKDLDVAFTEVQAKVNQAIKQLPNEADPPVVSKVEVGAFPIMWLTLTGDRTLQQLNLYADNVLKKQLETINGVGQIQIAGKRERTIRVELNLSKMAAFGVTANDIKIAFSREHIQLPGGFLVSKHKEQLIKLDFEYHNTHDLKQLIVKENDGVPVRIRNIGKVVDGLDDFRQLAHINGKDTVALGIVKVSDANAVAVIEAVEEKLETQIMPQLPLGISLDVASSNAEEIRAIVTSLKEHLVEGTLLAGLVVLVFLRSFRSTLIIATAIPVSLLGAVAAIYFLDYTFNILTLLGLLLLIGIVVDDAIVVLENIYRHRQEKNEDTITAAINGTEQVVFAVMAATLTLVSIFGAVFFMGGLVGRFFEAFAVVVASGVMISLFVSLTLIPMLCSRFLRLEENQHGIIHNKLNHMFVSLDAFYQKLLVLSINHRWKVLLITFLVVLSSGYFASSLGKGFFPQEDRGKFVITFKLPSGISIQTTKERLAKVEAVLLKYDDVFTSLTTVGLSSSGQINRGNIFVRLKPIEQRSVHQYELMAQLRQEMAGIPGIEVFIAEPSPIGGGRGEPLQFVITGSDLSKVASLSKTLRETLNQRYKSELGDIDLDLQLASPQLEFDIDRERAAELGLSAHDIAFAINMLAGGMNVGKYSDNKGSSQRYDIRVKAEDNRIKNKQDLSLIYLRTKSGDMIRLDSVATPRESIGAAVISRFDLRYAAYFYNSPNISLGDAVILVDEVVDELLPMGYQIVYLGKAREFVQTADLMIFTFGSALILVYMVLASQFNSWIQPMIVMTAQPLAVIGGLAALWLTGNSINIFSVIGMVLLVGLVAKNSILLVDLTNQLRKEGKEVDMALLEACPIRLRPVLMTSFTVILAMLPAAMGYGAGADTNAPLAIAVIGGMTSSTLLTLVVVPSLYSLVENRKGQHQTVRDINETS